MENESLGKLSRRSGRRDPKVGRLFGDVIIYRAWIQRGEERGRCFSTRQREERFSCIYVAHARDSLKSPAIEMRRQCVTFRSSSRDLARARVGGRTMPAIMTQGKRIWESFHDASGAWLLGWPRGQNCENGWIRPFP